MTSLVSIRRVLLLGFWIAAAGRCLAAPSFTAAIQQGNVGNGSISEASGVVASRANPNVLWTHNDSGDSARLFAMTPAGANLGAYSISGASASDWEDISIGPGPVAGQHYLYIADIGDNGLSRSSVSVYRVPEPTVSDLQSPSNTTAAGAVRLTLTYPDARRNAESMFVDPTTRDIYILSKDASVNRVYRAPYPQSTSGTTTLQLMTSFSTGSTLLTAADISPDGNEILIRSYGTSSGKLFVRPAGGSITDAFNTAPVTIPLASEPQGEAIGFDPNGRGYFTLSEGSSQPVYYFNRTASPPGPMYWDNDGVAVGTYAATGAGMGGSGTWNSSARKWYTGGAELSWVNGNDAIFWGTAGTVTLAAGQSLNSLAFKSNGYSLTGAAVTLTGSSTVTVDTGATANIGAPVAGSSGLVKNGLGTLVLTIGNTYSGTTTVVAGQLMLENTIGSGTGTGPVEINAGAVLGGIGTAQGDVLNQGTVAPGTATGTLHIGGGYTQGAAASLDIELASASTYDKLAVTGSASLGGTLAVSLIPSFVPTFGDEFAILSASGFGGSVFSAAELPSLPNGLTWNLNYGATVVSLVVGLTGDVDQNGAVDAADYVWWRKFDGTPATYESWRSNFGNTAPSATGTAIAIPEPMSWMLASIGAAALVVRSLVSHRKS